jgi:NAD(P)H-dependent FMN reductase
MYREMGEEVELVDLGELPAEIFLPSSYAEKPVGFARFSDAILSSGGVHVVTPEYNGGIPGVLKYFIDMLKFPESFERRPVCFVGLAAGMWGALRPVEQLQAIFGYRNAHIFPVRVFLPQVHSGLAEDGTISNPDWSGRLREQAEGFRSFAKILQS